MNAILRGHAITVRGVVLCTVSVCFGLHVPSNARASTPYALDPVVDPMLLAGAVYTMGATTALRLQQRFAQTCAPTSDGACDSKDLLAMDRYATRRGSDAWDQFSDVSEIAGITLPFVLDGFDVWQEGDDHAWADWGTDAVVLAQAQLLASSVTGALKVAVARSRPNQYDAEKYARSSGREQSFPSGHTTALTAGAVSYAATYWWRHPEDASRYYVAAAAALVSLVGGWARVEAGEHFATDVLAGLGIGTLFGVGVPWLHRRDTEGGRTQVVAPGASQIGVLVVF